MSPPDFINLSILRAACALVHPKNRTAGQSNNPPPENFLKPVCGISVVKRKITPVFAEVISYLVDSKGIEPSTSAMRKDFENFFGLFLLLLAVSAGFNFICKPL